MSISRLFLPPCSVWRPRDDPLRQVLSHGGRKPSGETPQPAASPAPLAAPEPARKLTVLVCEDDAIIRMDTADLVRELGYIAIETGSGREAIEIASREEIDILVTDVGLPDISGIELSRSLRELKPAIAIVFATGRDQVDGLEAEPRTEPLKKPYGLDLLGRVLGRVTD